MTNEETLQAIMRNLGRNDALDLRSRASDMDGTHIIREEEKIPDFDPTKDYTNWPVGSPVTDENQVWTLLQPYNAANYEGRPSTLRALWGLCHTKDPTKAKPFVEPLGTSGMYMEGECVLENNTIYKCLQDNTVYPPSAVSKARISMWEEVTL